MFKEVLSALHEEFDSPTSIAVRGNSAELLENLDNCLDFIKSVEKGESEYPDFFVFSDLLCKATNRTLIPYLLDTNPTVRSLGKQTRLKFDLKKYFDDSNNQLNVLLGSRQLISGSFGEVVTTT